VKEVGPGGGAPANRTGTAEAAAAELAIHHTPESEHPAGGGDLTGGDRGGQQGEQNREPQRSETAPLLCQPYRTKRVDPAQLTGEKVVVATQDWTRSPIWRVSSLGADG